MSFIDTNYELCAIHEGMEADTCRYCIAVAAEAKARHKRQYEEKASYRLKKLNRGNTVRIPEPWDYSNMYYGNEAE